MIAFHYTSLHLVTYAVIKSVIEKCGFCRNVAHTEHLICLKTASNHGNFWLLLIGFEFGFCMLAKSGFGIDKQTQFDSLMRENHLREW